MQFEFPGPEHAAETQCDALMEQNAILRSANQNLLLATFGAEDLRDQAEAAQRRQNEFLAMLAHELRNPLAPISMASAMLGKTPTLSPQLLHVKSVIDRQVGHLSRLLDDLLDAARINSGKIELHCQPLLVADQLTNALQTVQARLQERRQVLVLDIAELPVWILGDAVRLAQVFSNLLVNASKFTQDGGCIRLRAAIEGTNVLISVEDNGVGIATDILPTIFGLFTQGPRSLARSEGGLGVGLNVVRNVIEMHGGSVMAASAGQGHGSTFTITLPVMDIGAPVAAELPVAPESSVSHHILLIEDNVDANEMLEMVLCSEQHTVVAAFDGATGLALAREGDFDIVLSDVGLPGLSGYDVVRSLKASAGDDAPFCVAISGYGRHEDRALALAAGFDQHLVKPIDMDNLLQLIASAPHKLPHGRLL